MGYPKSNYINPYIYNVLYGIECFEISMFEPENSTIKLKNNILMFFPSMFYNNLELCIKEEENTYVLDEDETLVSSDNLIVFIK